MVGLTEVGIHGDIRIEKEKAVSESMAQALSVSVLVETLKDAVDKYIKQRQ